MYRASTSLSLIAVCVVVFLLQAVAAQVCSYTAPSGNHYDLHRAMTTSDMQGPSDGTPYTYWLRMCQNTDHCNSATAPPSPSPFCQTPTGAGSSYGCGSLTQFTYGELAGGKGIWILYTGGDRTARGPRQVNLTCACVGKAPSNPVSPTNGQYEIANAPGSFEVTFSSPHCCPTNNPLPHQMCEFCNAAVLAAELEMTSNPNMSIAQLEEYLQPACNTTVFPSVSNAACTSQFLPTVAAIAKYVQAGAAASKICSNVNLCR